MRSPELNTLVARERYADLLRVETPAAPGDVAASTIPVALYGRLHES